MISDHKQFDSPSPSPASFGPYTVYKRLKVDSIYNELFLVFDQRTQQRQTNLILLKLYLERQGYEIEHRVFAKSPHLADFYLGTSAELQYTLMKNLKYGSLIEYFGLVKEISQPAAKWLFIGILHTLKQVAEQLEIRHRSLYPSDILISDDHDPIVSGWSKITEDFSERHLVYDCGNILFFLCTGGRILDASLSPFTKGGGKSKRLSERESRKLKILAKSYKIANELLPVLQMCFDMEKYPETRIGDILEQEPLKQDLDASAIKQQLVDAEIESNAKRKQRQLDEMQRVTQRKQMIRDSQSKEIGNRSQEDEKFVQTYNKFEKEIEHWQEDLLIEQQATTSSFLPKEPENMLVTVPNTSEWAFVAAGLSSFIDENGGRDLLLPGDQVVLQDKSEVLIDGLPNQNEIEMVLKLNFQETLEEASSLKDHQIDVRVRLKQENHRQSWEVSVESSQCHQAYRHRIWEMVNEQITRSLGQHAQDLQ